MRLKPANNSANGIKGKQSIVFTMSVEESKENYIFYFPMKIFSYETLRSNHKSSLTFFIKPECDRYNCSHIPEYYTNYKKLNNWNCNDTFAIINIQKCIEFI